MDWFKFNKEVFDYKHRKARNPKATCYICGKRLKNGVSVGEVIINHNRIIGVFLVEQSCYKKSKNIVRGERNVKSKILYFSKSDIEKSRDRTSSRRSY